MRVKKRRPPRHFGAEGSFRRWNRCCPAIQALQASSTLKLMCPATPNHWVSTGERNRARPAKRTKNILWRWNPDRPAISTGRCLSHVKLQSVPPLQGFDGGATVCPARQSYFKRSNGEWNTMNDGLKVLLKQWQCVDLAILKVSITMRDKTCATPT